MKPFNPITLLFTIFIASLQSTYARCTVPASKPWYMHEPDCPMYKAKVKELSEKEPEAPPQSPTRTIETAEDIMLRFIDQGKKPPCTTFVQTVLEELGFRLSGSDIGKIQISGVAEIDIPRELRRGNPAMRGAPGMLIDKGLAENVLPNDAKPGDIIQYWYEDSTKAGGVAGHTGIIRSVHSSGHVTILDSNRKRGPNTQQINLLTKDALTIARPH